MPPFTVTLSRKAKAILVALGDALVVAREQQAVRRVDLLEKGLTRPLSLRVENDVAGVGVAALVAYLDAIDRLDVLEALVRVLKAPKKTKGMLE